MTMHSIWFVAAIVLVIAELFSGSLYLLAVAIGALAGAISAWFGMSIWVQTILCAVVTLVGVYAVQQRRKAAPQAPASRENPDLLIDLGSKVYVEAWQTNGTARVSHQGTEWDAQLETADLTTKGPTESPGGWYIIKAIDSNKLVLAPASKQPIV